MSCSNKATPLLLPITDVTVTQDGSGVRRGIEMGVGTPQQIFSLQPATTLQDLFVFNSADCVSPSNDSCIAQKGGVFNAKASSSYQIATEAQWNGTYDPHRLFNGTTSYIYFNDILHYGASGEAPGFPIFMDVPGEGTQGGLPLEANSTFLKTVYETGQVPSQTFGIWPGSQLSTPPVDGLLVVGGYDESRTNGNWTVTPTLGCPTCVFVAKMTYTSENGSYPLFANTSVPLQVALEPGWPGINLPQPIFDNFVTATGGPSNWFAPDNELIWTTEIPTGNISVTLSNGYQTTMLASELFMRPMYYNSKGQYSVQYSNLTVANVYNITPSTEGIQVWGMPFLTMNYMLVDHANDTLKLSPAIRDANIEPRISKICGPVPASAAKGTTSPSVQNGTNHIGAIVGGVIGGLVALALIIGAFVYMYGRHRNKYNKRGRNNDLKHSPSDSADDNLSSPAWVSSQRSELETSPSKLYVKHELPGQNGLLKADTAELDSHADDVELKAPVSLAELASPTSVAELESPDHAVAAGDNGMREILNEEKKGGASKEPIEMPSD